MLPALRTLVASETPALSSNASYSVMSGRDGVLAALAILVSAFISQGLSFSNLAFALFWPPAGIAFAVCWRFGARAIPSIALGIAVPTFILIPRWGSTLVVLGETLGPWAGVTILRRFGPTQTNDARLRWQIAFYMCGLAVACPIAALFGSLGGAVSHRFSMTDLPGVFLAYTIVEAIGLVLFAPIIIEWLNTRWSAATAADSNDLRNSTWPFVMAAGIEPMRWGLHFIAGASYADVLIFGYFPLVAWCALTATIQRTNALLLWIAIATLTSEALRLHSDGAPVANFDLFRIALVTLIVSTMGQVLAALASERRAAFADVARQRDLDPLTGLFNETSFARALDSAPRPLKVILFAFDNWPEFEILAGIGASYDLQREIADLVRQMPELTSVARLQPGTFAACLHSDADSPAPLTALLERRWSSKQVEMRLIAVALDVLEHDSSASSELLLGARTILSEALFSGDQHPILRRWSPALMTERRAYERLVDVIRHQVRAGHVHLFAQPILPVQSPQKPTLEILVRIDGEQGVHLPSADVARVLARNLVSTELDRVVIRATFEWFADHPRELLSVERIAINLTGASLSATALFDWIERCRLDSRLPAHHFAFEITEGQAILNMDCALSLVQRLRKAGYGVVLDDFGTGLATFDYLKRFPIDYLKIDGSFIRNLADSPVDREIVAGIVRLARVMQIGTVAEYVATEAIADAAVNAGIDALQGYAIQPPLPLGEALKWCRSSNAARWRALRDPLAGEALG